MSTILGNPITLGGGGADLNIDFGSTPPTDTSKLWVPLTNKPTRVTNSYSLIVEDFHQTKIDIYGHSVYPPIYSSICKYGNGYYIFGGGKDAYNSLTSSTARKIYYVDKSTGEGSYLSQTLPLMSGCSSCYIKNNYIYIFGCNSNQATYNPGGDQNIVRFNPADNTSEIVYRGSTSSASTSAGGGWCYCKIVEIDSDRILLCPSAMGTYTDLYEYSFSKNSVTKYKNSEILYQAKWLARDENSIYGNQYQGGHKKFNFITHQYHDYSFAYDSAINRQSPIWYIGGESYNVYQNNVRKFNVSSASFSNVASIPYSYSTNEVVSAYAQGNTMCWYPTAGSDIIYEIEAKQHLDKGTLYINCDFGQKEVLFVNDKNNKVYINPMSVYLGDNDSIAQKVDAYLYDIGSSTWKTLDGVSYTNDMIAALNIMGVS